MTLPATSFAELAVDLGMAARAEARGAEVLETQVPRDKGTALRRIRETALTEAKQSALRLAESHAVLRALAPYEHEIRSLLARATRGQAA